MIKIITINQKFLVSPRRKYAKKCPNRKVKGREPRAFSMIHAMIPTAVVMLFITYF
jgi:hypothetical protein